MNRILNVGEPTDPLKATCIIVSDEELDNFKTMVRRACMTWQDQPTSIRKLNDVFQFGSVQSNMTGD